MARKKNPNTNCLAGWQCPDCKSFGPFGVEAVRRVIVFDDGTEDDEDNGDTTWEPSSFAVCEECGKEATVSYFDGSQKRKRKNPQVGVRKL